jgi:hypothetical protein
MIRIFSSKYIVAALAVMTMTYNSNVVVYAQNSVTTETAVNNAQETVSKYIGPFFPSHRTHFLVVFRSQSHSSQSLQYPEARRVSQSRKTTFNTSFAVYRIHFRHARKSIYSPYIYQDRESKYSLQIHKPIFFIAHDSILVVFRSPRHYGNLSIGEFLSACRSFQSLSKLARPFFLQLRAENKADKCI